MRKAQARIILRIPHSLIKGIAPHHRWFIELYPVNLNQDS